MLFSGSIAGNIRYDRTVHDDEMLAAGRAARVSEFAEGLRGRYDASVGPAGSPGNNNPAGAFLKTVLWMPWSNRPLS